LRQIEQQYDLIIQPSSWSVERKKAYPKQRDKEQQTGTPSIIQQLQTAILTAAADKPAMPVLAARLLKDNIKVDVKYTRTGKVKGISYGIGEEHFAGNDLGKVFTFNSLQKHLGVSYDHSRDKPVIESLQESFTRGRVIDDARIEHLQNWLWWREREETLTATGDDFQRLTAPVMPPVVHRAIATVAPTGVPSPTHPLESKQTQPQELTVPAALLDSVASPSIFEKLKLSINAAAADYPSMPEMIAKLYSTGVKVKVEFSTHGLATGISYEIDGISTNSSNLGEQYSFEGLQNLGVDYNPEWDNRLIETIVDYSNEGHVINDSYIERLRRYRQTKQLEQQRMEQVNRLLGIEQGLPMAIAPVEPENIDNQKAVIHTDSQSNLKAPPDNEVAATIPTTIGDRYETIAENSNGNDSVSDNDTLEEDAATESNVLQASISQEYADKIGATIRLLWQRQGQPNQIKGQHYDLELALETLLVMRKSGEQIASISLKELESTSFHGFIQKDWDRFDKIDAVLKAKHLEQRQQRYQGGMELD
ncbi:MAG: hypothetical protein PUP92_33790, partial [Rhizonema sp. PD38]|nr:hypothetical protein [Rhizonema sp. PD38]